MTEQESKPKKHHALDDLFRFIIFFGSPIGMIVFGYDTIIFLSSGSVFMIMPVLEFGFLFSACLYGTIISAKYILDFFYDSDDDEKD